MPFLSFFAVPSDVPTASFIQLNSTYEDGVAVAVPMSTYEGCSCRAYDLQHSPSWILLLLLIVDQLVYHAALLSSHIYHPAHAFNKIEKRQL